MIGISANCPKIYPTNGVRAKEEASLLQFFGSVYGNINNDLNGTLTVNFEAHDTTSTQIELALD